MTTGQMFAPNGRMEYDGADQEMHQGALVALTIVANGSGGGPLEIALIK